jgi:hypothetical protein
MRSHLNETEQKALLSVLNGAGPQTEALVSEMLRAAIGGGRGALLAMSRWTPQDVSFMASLAPAHAVTEQREAAVRQIAEQMRQQRESRTWGASTLGSETALTYDPSNDPASHCFEAGANWDERTQSCPIQGIDLATCDRDGGRIENGRCIDSRTRRGVCIAFGGQWDERRDLCAAIALR